jgi:hypothetical protein
MPTKLWRYLNSESRSLAESVSGPACCTSHEHNYSVIIDSRETEKATSRIYVANLVGSRSNHYLDVVSN